jgi:hypothetical protein
MSLALSPAKITMYGALRHQKAHQAKLIACWPFTGWTDRGAPGFKRTLLILATCACAS